MGFRGPKSHGNRAEKPGWRIRPAVLWRDVCAFWTGAQTCQTTARLRQPRLFFMGFRGSKFHRDRPTSDCPGRARVMSRVPHNHPSPTCRYRIAAIVICGTWKHIVSPLICTLNASAKAGGALRNSRLSSCTADAGVFILRVQSRKLIGPPFSVQ